MKKLSFVFDWIGPKGPVRNGEIPDIVDLARSHIGYNIQNSQSRLPNPIIHTIFRDSNNIHCDVYSSYNLPDHTFLYELSTLECSNFYSLFNDRTGFISNFNDKYISNTVLNSIKLKKGYYVISNPYESFMDDNVLTFIQNYFKNKNIPLSQVIYATCSPNANDIYLSYCQRHELIPEMKCEFIPIYASNYASQFKNSSDTELTYTPGYRNKDFLCFNRRYRNHRLLFGLMLEKYNLLDRCSFSLDKNQPEVGRDFIEFVNGIRNIDMSKLEINDEIINSLYNKLPLILDTSDFTNINMMESTSIITNLYKDSLIHIISETNFFTPIIHQTEKTIKPIINLQPFIILGSRFSLKSIKDMGFKTFDKFWDESYDDEVDDSLRLIKITELCKTISEWSPERKIEFTHEVKEIIDYNYNHLIHGRLIELDKWIEKYGN